MTLNDFRILDTLEGNQKAAQLNWIAANLILMQNPRLERGDDMEGPIGLFKDGRKAEPPPFDFANDDPLGQHSGGPVAITAQTVKLSVQQLTGHPWLDGSLAGNYLHMYSIEERSPYGEKRAGETITVKYGERRLQIGLTQSLIDEATYFLVRFGISK